MNALLNTYSRFPVEFVEGKGSKLFDKNGREYLDLLSGIAVTGFGHRHKEITKAAEEQINKLWHVSNLFESSPQQELAGKLVESSGLDSVFFCNSGTEANEAAIKFARKWGGNKKKIISTYGSFHGRTMGSLSATGKESLWKGFSPMLEEFSFAEYNNIESIKNIIDENTCAIMVEPVQGENGVIIPEEGYLVKLRQLCDENNLLLILDEVQTGIGRTGKIFAYQWENIKPDLVTLAKGIANGLPLGAVVCSKEISGIIEPGDHGSTFGGNPVSVAAANKVFDLLNAETLDDIIYKGNLIKTKLNEIESPLIISIRGKGLMIAIEFNKPVSKELIPRLLKQGVVVGGAGESIIRLYPSFLITEGEISNFIEIIKKVINEF